MHCTRKSRLSLGLSGIPPMNVCWNEWLKMWTITAHYQIWGVQFGLWWSTNKNVCARGYRQPTNGKHLTFCDPVAPFPMKWSARNECRNFIRMSHYYPDLDSALNFNHSTIFWLVVNLKHFPDLRSDKPLVWNFCASYSSDVISLENQQLHHKMLAIFSG